MQLSSPIYLDSSALVKLVIDEAGSSDLYEFLLETDSQMASSELADVEIVRTIMKLDPEKMNMAVEVLASTVLLPLTTEIRIRAGLVHPGSLRSLDAIHLSTAMEIREDLDCLITYDKRMAVAGPDAGLRVMSPGDR